jgi:transcription elongation factor S-II
MVRKMLAKALSTRSKALGSKAVREAFARGDAAKSAGEPSEEEKAQAAQEDELIDSYVTAMEGDLNPVDTAIRIEIALYQEIIHTSGGYCGSENHKKKLKMFVSNLNDVKNPKLVVKVLTGKITPEEFAKYGPNDMKSDDLKKLAKEAHELACFNNFMAFSKGAISKDIQCGKCGAKETEYTQRQTRSADEPMTTFCTCTKCGARWRFC